MKPKQQSNTALFHNSASLARRSSAASVEFRLSAVSRASMVDVGHFEPQHQLVTIFIAAQVCSACDNKRHRRTKGMCEGTRQWESETKRKTNEKIADGLCGGEFKQTQKIQKKRNAACQGRTAAPQTVDL